MNRNPPSFSTDLQTLENRELWASVRSLTCFLAKEKKDKISELPGFSDALPSLLDEKGSQVSFLPIEFYKDFPQKYFQGVPEKIFQSSGTTKKNRSQSQFSTDGLELYRLGALKTFWSFFNEVLGEDMEAFQGVSLVPKGSEWSDSSLAQMMAWIDREFGVRYLTPEEFKSTNFPQGEKPLWIFGTAFHFMEFEHLAKPKVLPPGSVVMETGGTKGRTRDVSHEELCDIICENLGVARQAIHSEYGMCELAAQAYSFRDEGHKCFRFPSWVRLFVDAGEGVLKTSGKGSLLVYDPLRIDYPWPMRTQDIVTLKKDSSFILHGRAQTAPLKGCSLLAEEILNEPSSKVRLKDQVPSPSSRREKTPESLATLDSRQKNVIRRVREFFCDDKTQVLMTESGLGKKLAALACEDLVKTFPDSDQEWIAAINSCVDDASLEKWLLILPGTHEIAGVYPIVMASLVGIRLTVRVPSDFRMTRELVETLTELGADLLMVGPEFRVDEKVDHSFDAVMVFGSDETVAKVARHACVPTVGFGTSIAAGVVWDFSRENLNLLAKDVASLDQKGCMSTRIVLAQKPLESSDDLWRGFFSLLEENRGKKFDFEENIGRSYERVRYQFHLGARIIGDAPGPIVALVDWSQVREKPLEAVSQVPFVVPVVYFDNWTDEIEEFLTRLPARVVTTDRVECIPNKRRRAIRYLGEANQPSWDGCYEGRPLFAVR